MIDHQFGDTRQCKRMDMALDQCLPTDTQQWLGGIVRQGTHALTTTGREYHGFHGLILPDSRKRFRSEKPPWRLKTSPCDGDDPGQ